MVDEQTFVSEVQAMERTLYRVARSFLPTWEECGDAVQEALGKAWAKRGRVEPEYFRPWLTRIVINECHNIGRRKRRVSPLAVVEPPQDAAPDLGLREVVSALPERLRIPLLLHHLEGFSVSEVAQMTRVPEGTVKSRLHQARECLKAEWEVRCE